MGVMQISVFLFIKLLYEENDTCTEKVDGKITTNLGIHNIIPKLFLKIIGVIRIGL